MMCNPTYARFVDSTNGICTAKLYTSNAEKVVFLNSRNDFSLFTKTGTIQTFNEGSLKCPGGDLASKITLSINGIVGYTYSLRAKILAHSN